MKTLDYCPMLKTHFRAVSFWHSLWFLRSLFAASSAEKKEITSGSCSAFTTGVAPVSALPSVASIRLIREDLATITHIKHAGHSLEAAWTRVAFQISSQNQGLVWFWACPQTQLPALCARVSGLINLISSRKPAQTSATIKQFRSGKTNRRFFLGRFYSAQRKVCFSGWLQVLTTPHPPRQSDIKQR